MTQASTKPKNKKDVRDIRAEALKIANSIKVEGQTKAEIKAIASGIQQGMEQFLRQQSEKTRDLDKRVKKVKQLAISAAQDTNNNPTPVINNSPPARLPWVLLATSWVLFFIVAASFWLRS
jgi:arsenate reductase-like glutaredoxin family protein